MFVFLLPYVCASLWGHVGVDAGKLREGSGGASGEAAVRRIRVDMDWGVWEMPLEEYVACRLSETMPEDYEPEALKAQAVLIRTEAVRAGREQGESGGLPASGDGLKEWYGAGKRQVSAVYTEAVRDTVGLYLAYEGEPVQAPYFKVSSGRTRDAGDVWRTDQFPYLQGTDCAQDKAAQDYRSDTAVSRTGFLREIQSRAGAGDTAEKLWENMRFERDGAGYVTEVVFDMGTGEDVRMDGEEFRYLFGLASASFEAERTDTQIVFHVTGVGHGFGMSQYGANCRAVNGETFDQILKDFFCGTELAKIE